MAHGPIAMAGVLVAAMALAAPVPVAAERGFLAPTVLPDSATGLPMQVAADAAAGNLLARPVSLVLREGGKELPTPGLAAEGAGAFAGEAPGAAMRVELRHGSALFPFLEVTLTSDAAQARDLTCTLVFPVRQAADRAFFPAGERPRFALEPGAPPATYGYTAAGTGTAMPLAQLYSEKEDWGLALFEDLGELVEPMSTCVSRSDKETRVEVTLYFPCGPQGSATRRLYFVATRGDWRPALGAILAQFPGAFEPQNPQIAALHGPFVCSGGTPPDADIERWYAQGCRVVEIHGTPPWYGEYVPKADKWTPFADDRWHFLKPQFAAGQRPADDAPWREIRDFVESQVPPTMTQDAVRDYIERLHRHGMEGLIYFNPTEAWAPWAEAEFRDDRLMAPNGKPHPTWYESSCMIPDKSRPWGKYVLEQLRGELASYPQVDGVFFDQSAGGGHDLTELCAEGCRIVRAQGKICWWNGPYNMELATLADGMMTEGGGSETYRQLTEIIQYYGVAGRPIVSLGAGARGDATAREHGARRDR